MKGYIEIKNELVWYANAREKALILKGYMPFIESTIKHSVKAKELAKVLRSKGYKAQVSESWEYKRGTSYTVFTVPKIVDFETKITNGVLVCTLYDKDKNGEVIEL